MPDSIFARQLASRRDILQAIGAASLIAGGAAAVPAASAQDSSPEPVQGGTIIYDVGQEGSHLVPSFSSFSTVIVPTVAFFNGLTRPGLDLQPEPDLAESWDVNEDGTHYVFHLRDGVTFHDGEPFTANDVKFTWELIAHPDNVSGAQLYDFFKPITGAEAFRAGEADEITGIVVVDDLTLEVSLDHTWAPFDTIGTSQYIVPQHILGEIPVSEILASEYARNPIGTGPYHFVAWNAGESYIGEANESYHFGRPLADTVVLRVAWLDDNQKITALRAGEINATTISLVGLDSLGSDHPEIVTLQEPGKWNQYVEFNLARPIFQDIRVRKALSYATDRQTIVDAVYQGRATIYNSVFPYAWDYTKTDTTLYDNDKEEAARLLDEAGWVLGDDGIREKDGEKLSFTIISLPVDWSIVLQQQWREVGVETQVDVVDWPTLSTQYYVTGLFDAAALHVPYNLYADPHYSLPGYFLSANNRNQYNNPKSDELIIAAASTIDHDERVRLYHEWQEVIAQDVPHLWIANPDTVRAYSAGLVVPEASSIYFAWQRIADWYWAE